MAASYVVRTEEATRYLTTVCISVGSVVLMILLLDGCTLWFWIEIKAKTSSREIIEKVEG